MQGVIIQWLRDTTHYIHIDVKTQIKYKIVRANLAASINIVTVDVERL